MNHLNQHDKKVHEYYELINIELKYKLMFYFLFIKLYFKKPVRSHSAREKQ